MNEERYQQALELAEEIKKRGLVLIGERVAILRDERKESTTAAGIILPENAKPIPIRGTIVAIGNDVDLESDRYKGLEVGLRMNFVKYHLAEMTYKCLDGREVTIEIMHATDVYFAWPGGVGE